MEFSSVNTIWVLLGAALVFFMQAGFSMCEAGFTRAKNTGNILMKNLMDFCIGTPCFWLVGFGIMFGAGTGLFGWFDPMIMKDYSSILPSGVPLWAYAIFQTVFCATSATIVSGAMAERTKFSAYCIYSAAISLLIYPISGHWIWGGGWLSELGFHDFAGSTCVHMVGGVCALIGATVISLESQLLGRAHLARQCARGGKSKLGALLRERKVTGRDASLPAPLLTFPLEWSPVEQLGRCPKPHKGAPPLDPARDIVP